MTSKNDLTNIRFGRLTAKYRVDDYVEPNGTHRARWHCVCDCGKEKDVLATSLLRDKTRSCGCLIHDTTCKINKNRIKNNRYDLTGEYGIGWTLHNQEFYFDLEDYDIIKDYRWNIDHQGYVIAYIRGSNQKSIKMHNLVMQPKSNYFVDHIYGKRNDNRKSQLRYLTDENNRRNRVVGKNNTSGVIGVHFDNTYKIWKAQIGYHKTQIVLGSFKTFEEAVEARVRAEWELLPHDVAPNRDKFPNYNLKEGDAHNA